MIFTVKVAYNMWTVKREKLTKICDRSPTSDQSKCGTEVRSKLASLLFSLKLHAWLLL